MESDSDKLAAALNNVANQIGLLEVKFSHYVSEQSDLVKEVTTLKSELRTIPMQVTLLWGTLIGGATILAIKWFTAVDHPQRLPTVPQSIPHKSSEVVPKDRLLDNQSVRLD